MLIGWKTIKIATILITMTTPQQSTLYNPFWAAVHQNVEITRHLSSVCDGRITLKWKGAKICENSMLSAILMRRRLWHDWFSPWQHVKTSRYQNGIPARKKGSNVLLESYGDKWSDIPQYKRARKWYIVCRVKNNVGPPPVVGQKTPVCELQIRSDETGQLA